MAPRVDTHRLLELIRLTRLGTSARGIARLLRMSPKTERRYRALLHGAGLLHGEPGALPALHEVAGAVLRAWPRPEPARSPLVVWRTQVDAWVGKGLSARAIFDRLRLEVRGFRGSYSAVRRFVQRRKRSRGVQPEDVAVPILTAPGREAQVDFGYAGRLFDPATGRVRRAWVFVMLLCHSRHMFAQLVFDQKTETWLALHEQAFRAFGGVVGVVIPDNTKRAVLRAAFGVGEVCELERSYRELAQSWGFTIDPAPPGAPCKRGKAEAAVKYLRNNPLKGRDGEALPDVEAALQRWCSQVAAVRVHGTTGRRPLDVFLAEERAALGPLPTRPVPRAVWKRAKVHADSHVSVRGRLFSVPWQLIHERVWVRVRESVVEVFHQDRLVATHEDERRARTTDEAHLPANRRGLRNRSRAHWEARAGEIGPATLVVVRGLFERDEVLSHLRAVQAIVRFLEQFPRARAEAASMRASETGDVSYRGIKRTLTSGLDLVAQAAPLTSHGSRGLCSRLRDAGTRSNA